ncbi:hypothetical protein JHD49_04390 [Sulfurimonas sp. SAG-AH-194-C21]|nr:hypothetical protein [Sulfurimonas sp. SAG-AH-194-C21]
MTMKIMEVHNSDKSVSHIIYTGPFTTYERAAHYQQKLKSYFSNPQVVVLDKKDKTDGMFFGLGLGYASATTTYDKDKQAIKLKEPQNYGISFMGEVGYVFKNGMFSTIGYSTLKNSDLFFENIYVSLGYRFYNKGKFTPYLSALAGIGSLTWENIPLAATNGEVVNKSISPIFGGRVGLIYNGFESFSFAASYHLLTLDHTADIYIDSTNKSSYKHSTLHSFLLEFQHKF